MIRDEVSGAAGQVLSQYQNLGAIQTSGIDANLNWRADVADLGLASIPGSLVDERFVHEAVRVQGAGILDADSAGERQARWRVAACSTGAR